MDFEKLGKAIYDIMNFNKMTSKSEDKVPKEEPKKEEEKQVETKVESEKPEKETEVEAKEDKRDIRIKELEEQIQHLKSLATTKVEQEKSLEEEVETLESILSKGEF